MEATGNIFDEIRYLRGAKDFEVDRENSNRYKILVKDVLGSTAYCFSTPVYDLLSGKIVSLKSSIEKGIKSFKGSNCEITVKENVCTLENQKGRITIEFQNEMLEKNISIYPTLNGLHFSVIGDAITFKMNSNMNQSGIWVNDQQFSVMVDKFLPFASVSALFANDENGNCFPVSLQYEEKGEREYEISVFCAHHAKRFRFEVNFYEHKLFQDTTVESKNPDKNNAFGSIAFIGNTEDFGEQWLYLRPDFSRISDMYSKTVEHIYLHIPVLNGSDENVDTYIPQKRFCSFGSTWNKKVDHVDNRISSVRNGKYLTLDVTAAFTNAIGHGISYNEGLIIKKPKNASNTNDFITISTGDNYSYPQILEIKYK